MSPSAYFFRAIFMVAVVAAEKAGEVLKFVRAQGHKAWPIGEVVNGKGRARVVA